MKTLSQFFVLLSLFTLSAKTFSQEKKRKETITVQTSAQCEQCKDRLEKKLAYTKGVKKSNLDLNTKGITVVYNPKKTTPEKIREIISKTGYDADSIAADAGAYQNLPGCCKKGGH